MSAPVAGVHPEARAAADVVRARLGPDTPVLGLILGSGLGGLARRLTDRRELAFEDVPGLPRASVAGHPGRLIAGMLAGRPVIALAGRLHVYEGHPVETVAFPVRLLHALGVPAVLVSNAAGGLRRTFRPGDLMVINDHLNLAWRNPLIGPLVPGDQRFPDMSGPYDAEMRARLHVAARSSGTTLQDGVYAWVAGPAYETTAEIRMLERLGADAVGMSTVPEVIVARALGLRVAGVSCITNMAAGLAGHRITHEDVLRATEEAAGRFETVVTEFVRAGL